MSNGPQVAGTAIWLAGLALLTACGGEPDGAARVRAFVEAHNASDVEGQLALFADEARVHLPDGSAIEGKPEIRRLLEWEAALDDRLVVPDLAVRGDTVVAGATTEESLWFARSGVGSVQREPGTAFVFAGGRLVEMRVAPLVAADRERTQQAIGDFARWAAGARPELLERLLSGNRFAYSAEAAALWLEALDAWQAAASAASSGADAGAGRDE